jgi:hypothetical protein
MTAPFSAAIIKLKGLACALTGATVPGKDASIAAVSNIGMTGLNIFDFKVVCILFPLSCPSATDY